MAKENQMALLLPNSFGKRKRVFFVESILPQPFIGQLGFLFDLFMRAYGKIDFLLIIVCYIINEFVSEVVVFNFIFYYCYFQFTIIIIAYYFHCRLRDYIGDDVNKWITINMTNGVDRRVDVLSFITLWGLRIPPEFKTEHPFADRFLMSIQQSPFIYNLTWTIIDHKYLRFSWMKIDKTKPKQFISSLEPADYILYHSKKSIIGRFIRFITRCYWNHSACYMGDGKVFDLAPGGAKLIDIMEWLQDDNIELTVLRSPIDGKEGQIKKELMIKDYKENISRGYGYYSALKDLWHILINKKGDGFMKLHIFLINIMLILIILFTYLKKPYLIRTHLFLFIIFTPYLFGTVYHWWAYKKKFEELNKYKVFYRYK